MKRNIKLVLEYDGTNYHGWQEQKELPTIQGCLREAIYELCKEDVIIYGAGRTDAGVHARSQVANFHTESKIPDYAFSKALNTFLPMDIVIHESQEVPESFHAQFSVKSKAYSYNIINRKTRPVLDQRFYHWVWYPLNIEKIKEAARYFVGTHDFSAFEAADSPRKSNIRTVNYLEVTQNDFYIKIQIEADGFLYRMVRNITGTLIGVGNNKYEPEYVKTILESQDRSLAGNTAPPNGLILEYIKY